jgi:hypothetical protein
MASLTKLFAIRPGSAADAVTMTPVDAAALGAGYTNVTVLPVGASSYACAYNKSAGSCDLYRLSDAAPWLTPVTGRIALGGGPWDNLTAFVLGGDPYVLTYRAQDGTFGFFRVGDDLSSSPPFTFALPRNTPTPGFTDIAVLGSLGIPYILAYNNADGTVAAFSIAVTTGASGSGNVPSLQVLNVWYHRWAKGWTRFAFFQLGGANFFFKINTDKLNVNIDHLNDNPAGGTVEVGTALQGQLPDALTIDRSAIVPWSTGDPYLLTYIAASGATTIYRIHGDCLGWTAAASAMTVAGASLVVPFAVAGTSYALFYGAG